MFKNGYFKGWYFKCSTANKTIAFIPAYHQHNKKETASLQIIMDDAVFSIPFDKLVYSEKPLLVKLGNCIFSEKGIYLDVNNDNINIRGKLRFRSFSPIKYDIMGPFVLFPFMQCRHSVFSMKHRIDGRITVNGKVFDFKNGIGYLEGDSGHSFPDKYIWTQCSFKDDALMLSVASIDLLGFAFTGIIGVVLLNGKEFRLATYLGAKVKHIGKSTIIIKQGNYLLTAKLIEKNSFPLNAPVDGKMSRTIHESASCKAYYKFSYKNKVLCEFTSDKASFEFEMI